MVRDITGTTNPIPSHDCRQDITATYTLANLPPIAEAGTDQTATVGSAVTLDASASKDETAL